MTSFLMSFVTKHFDVNVASKKKVTETEFSLLTENVDKPLKIVTNQPTSNKQFLDQISRDLCGFCLAYNLNLSFQDFQISTFCGITKCLEITQPMIMYKIYKSRNFMLRFEVTLLFLHT